MLPTFIILQNKVSYDFYKKITLNIAEEKHNYQEKKKQLNNYFHVEEIG